MGAMPRAADQNEDSDVSTSATAGRRALQRHVDQTQKRGGCSRWNDSTVGLGGRMQGGVSRNGKAVLGDLFAPRCYGYIAEGAMRAGWEERLGQDSACSEPGLESGRGALYDVSSGPGHDCFQDVRSAGTDTRMRPKAPVAIFQSTDRGTL